MELNQKEIAEFKIDTKKNCKFYNLNLKHEQDKSKKKLMESKFNNQQKKYK